MAAELPPVRHLTLSSHRSSARSVWLSLEAHAADATVGIAECSDGGTPGATADVIRVLEQYVVGRPADADRSALRAEVDRRRRAVGGAEALLWSTAWGGLESALDDLTARQLGLPLSTYLGLGDPRPVAVYANLNRRWGGHGPAAVVAAAAAAGRDGFTAVKIAPFPAPGQPAARDQIDSGIAVVDAVRDVLPASTLLMVDLHHLVPMARLEQALRLLEPRRIHWVEDAVDVRDLAGLRHIASTTSIPLAGGEHVWDPETVEAACATGALGYWLVDPKHAGGPHGTRALLDLTGDTKVTFHNPSGPVGTAHAAQLTALGTGVRWLELAYGESDRTGMLDPPEDVRDGILHPAPGPGIGAMAVPRSARPRGPADRQLPLAAGTYLPSEAP